MLFTLGFWPSACFACICFSWANCQLLITNCLVQRLPCHFFQRGHAFFHFHQAAAPQRDHASLNVLFLQFHGGRANQNQLTYFIVHFHHFIQAVSSLVSCTVANGATFSLEN